MIVEMKAKSQVTIPAGIVKKANLKRGDSFDVRLEGETIVLEPVVFVPRKAVSQLEFANEMDARFDRVAAGQGEVHDLVEA